MTELSLSDKEISESHFFLVTTVAAAIALLIIEALRMIKIQIFVELKKKEK